MMFLSDYPTIGTGFAIIGICYAVYSLFLVTKAVLGALVLSGVGLHKYGPKGSWAVVTGASDGLGKEFALQLSRKGFNIFLISRTKSKLEAIAAEIGSSSKVDTLILDMDFARDDDEDYAKLYKMLEGLAIAILVNNVGKSHDVPVPFALTPKQELQDIITINCIATLKVTQLVVPKMISQHRGLIMTIGSIGGWLPTPLLATYSGSKAFLQQWSTSMGAELKPHGIDVELVLSYLVVSAMSKVRKTSMMVPSPKTFVASVLGKVRRSGGPQNMPFTSTPFWSHALFQSAIEMLLGRGSSLLLGVNKKMHEGIRAAALRKAARGEKKAA